MDRIRHNQLVLYQFNSLRYRQEISHAIFTRRGGVSKPPYDSLNVGSTVGDDVDRVKANQQIMSGFFGVDSDSVCTTWQVHGSHVICAHRKAPDDNLPRADGIITNEPHLPLVMRFADCIPLVLYDPVQHVIGLAHAGWRGTVAGIGQATVRKMSKAYGVRPRDIIAGIGPGIGPCCYEVGPEVVLQVRATYLDYRDLVIPPPNGNGHGSHLDLWRANRLALEAVGVRQIETANLCTACLTDEFYSHRAESGKTGRFGVMIMLNN
nr:peptidoglycan editing factor PgeF [Anaerolineae bacterium]